MMEAEVDEKELKEVIEWFKEQWKDHIDVEKLGEDEVKIVIGRIAFTPKELLEQMEKKTYIGLKHAKIIKEYLKWKGEKI